MNTYPTQNTFKDDDMSKGARTSRFGERLGLMGLPFRNEEQDRRVDVLENLIKRDNKFAFQQDCYNAKRAA